MATSNSGPAINNNLSLSAEGQRRLRRRESVRGYYNDGGGNRGNCTYGIGILLHRGPCTSEELARPLTAAQIESSFRAAVREAERAVRRNVNRRQLTQEQFDALVSFTFNTGAGRAHRVLQRVNQGDLAGAAAAIRGYTFSSRNGRMIPMPGLVSRRLEESAPFRPTRQE
ncbi:MAG TPA: lysozyme [Burkholderiaceae bacterium]|nr:lysozyme [Burkholderiaceae bacterium]